MKRLYAAGLLRRIIAAAGAVLFLFLAGAAATAFGQEGGPPDLGRRLAQLERILRRPEFQWQDSEPTLLERFWSWLARQLFSWLPASAEGGQLVAIILAAVGIFAILGALLYIAVRLRRQIVPGKEQSAEDALMTMRDPEEALASAETMAMQGDYRMALRYLYLSTLLLLDKRGLINYDRTRTNREYLLSVRDRPQLEAILREIVQVFDRSWYGIQAPDARTYEQFVSHVNTLREMR